MMENFYFVDGLLIADVNTFVPAHLQIDPPDGQYLPEAVINEWIAEMTGNPGAAAAIAALNAILIAGPADIASAGSGIQQDMLDTWNGLKSINILSDTDDFSDPDFLTITGWRATTVGNQDLTGIVNPTESQQYKLLVNLGPGDISLRDQDTGSVASARFALPNEANFNLREFQSVQMIHDSALDRWILVSRS